MLALAPGTRTAPGTGANTGRFIHPELADERVFAGLHYAGYDAWLDHVWPAAACTRPIRLRGDIKHIDATTGELLRTVPTIAMPGVTRPDVSMAVLPPASPGTPVTMPGSASRCARTATTTPPTSSGTTRQANYGGAPNKPSNVTSASSPAAEACSPSGFPAATVNTAWSTRYASRTARPPSTRH